MTRGSMNRDGATELMGGLVTPLGLTDAFWDEVHYRTVGHYMHVPRAKPPKPSRSTPVTDDTPSV